MCFDSSAGELAVSKWISRRIWSLNWLIAHDSFLTLTSSVEILRILIRLIWRWQISVGIGLNDSSISRSSRDEQGQDRERLFVGILVIGWESMLDCNYHLVTVSSVVGPIVHGHDRLRWLAVQNTYEVNLLFDDITCPLNEIFVERLS